MKWLMKGLYTYKERYVSYYLTPITHLPITSYHILNNKTGSRQ